MDRLSKIRLDEFAEQLASKAPVPGGGGAAACSAAMAASLCSMACRLSSGKKQLEAREGEIQALLEESDRLRERLLDLVDEDAKAFEPLAKAWKIPKDDPARAGVIEECTLRAARIPMETLRLSARIAEICAELIDGRISELLVSDAGNACEIAKGAACASLLNVAVNTAALRDRAEAAALNSEAAGIYMACEETADTVFDAVTERLMR